MTGVSDWFLPLMGGNTLLSATLGYLMPAFVSRKKDAGELANEMLTKALERIDKLESDSAACHHANLTLTMRCERNELVLQLAITDLHARAPESPVLAQARALLDRAFPMPSGMPDGQIDQPDPIERLTA